MNLNSILRKLDYGDELSSAEKYYLEHGKTMPAKTLSPVGPIDDISSGLGIGGIGSDDYSIHTEPRIADYRPQKCGGGQRYDEQCAGCGRETTICNDCELCERCHKKD